MKEYTWRVTYGPFSEDVCKLNAERLGWRQTDGDIGIDSYNPGSAPVAMIDFLTDRLKHQQVQQLSQAKIEAETAAILEQAAQVKEQISQAVSTLVNYEVEQNERTE
jgi:hypothetical protein